MLCTVCAEMNLRNFKYIALIEATTFLLLLIASYIKQTGDQQIGVQILGPIHGLLFIAYVIVALGVREGAGWTTKQTLLILLGAVVPFGGYFVDRWVDENNGAELQAETAARS
jgi:integral membrane protein